MCGISGIVKFDGSNVNVDDIKLMMSTMNHRGPDDEGVFFENNIGLGFVRLSILDLTTNGNQPMYSNDNRFVIVYNGEVYNYLELKQELKKDFVFKTKTDTEVVLNAFQKWGVDCVKRFNGMFSFVILDKLTKEIYGFRDRFGVKPFYYFQNDKTFIFASEIKSILPLVKNISPNEKIIFDYIAYNRTDHTNETFFENIYKLEHGCYFKLTNDNFFIKKWYNLKDYIRSERKIIEPEEYLNLLTDSIKLRLRSDVPVGVSLSGGLDSSTITSILFDKLKVKNLTSFSSVYNSQKDYDEKKFIDLYKSNLENMLFTYPSKDTFLNDFSDFIYAQTEPVNDVGSYIQYKVMSLVGEHVKVVLDGQGADEQLGGYHNFFGSYYKELFKKGKFSKLFSELSFYAKIHKSNESLKYFIYYLIPKIFKSRFNFQNYGSIEPKFYSKYYSESNIVSNLYHPKDLQSSMVEHFEFKLEHLLKWDDLNSMRFSVESRVPFLDYRLVETSLNLNSNLIIDKGMTKKILRESVKTIVPLAIVNRIDKKGFSNPRAEWYRTYDFKNLILQTLNSDDFKNLKIFNVDDAMKKYKLHLECKHDYSIDIWKWINIHEWYKKFIF